jgi:uncharacterized SAM-binding protein YcdF (DUF218 family)
VKLIRRTALVLAAAFILIFFLFAPAMAALGGYLVKAGPPQKADIIVVLAGDGFGHRILTAAELAREGYAPKVLVSGPDGSYGEHECDLAIPFAVKAGYPESMFVHFEHRARSTTEEIQLMVPKLRAMGVKRVLLVTSDYHTRRSGKIFHRIAPDIEVFVVAAPDEYFKADRWWKDREGRKSFLYEWMKTVAEY